VAVLQEGAPVEVPPAATVEPVEEVEAEVEEETAEALAEAEA
jgi:hypothetical protein